MTGNTKLSFDIDELNKLNSDITDARHSIQDTFSKIKSCFEDLKTNVTGTQINGLITTITDNLTAIDSKMTTSFDQLSTFLNSQMRNYATTYEGAKAALTQALSFIDNNL